MTPKQKQGRIIVGTIMIVISLIIIVLGVSIAPDQEEAPAPFIAGIMIMCLGIVFISSAKKEEQDEINSDNENNDDIKLLRERLEKEKLKHELNKYTQQYVVCKYCGTKNKRESEHCSSCNAVLDK